MFTCDTTRSYVTRLYIYTNIYMFTCDTTRSYVTRLYIYTNIYICTVHIHSRHHAFIRDTTDPSTLLRLAYLFWYRNLSCGFLFFGVDMIDSSVTRLTTALCYVWLTSAWRIHIHNDSFKFDMTHAHITHDLVKCNMPHSNST